MLPDLFSCSALSPLVVLRAVYRKWLGKTWPQHTEAATRCVVGQLWTLEKTDVGL